MQMAVQRQHLRPRQASSGPSSAMGACRWRDSYPAAVRCLLADRDSLTVYLRFPREHWTRVRHSNFIERSFGETRRRVKVIGRLPGEHSCLSLVWAVLDRASRGWRGFTMTAAGLRLLQDLRRSLLEPPTPLRHTNEQTARPPDSVGAVAQNPISREDSATADYTAPETRPGSGADENDQLDPHDDTPSRP